MFAFGSWQGTAGSQRLELSVVTIARNCRFPEDGTLGSQPGNQRLPLQATAGSQRLELSLPNLGTTGYHCKELPVPRRLELLVPNLGAMGYHCKQLLKWYENIFVTTLWFCLMDRYRTLGSQRLELSVANVGTTGYHCKELPVPRGWNSWFPTWEPEVTIASNCRLPKVGTLCCQRGNHRLPLQATAGSQRLELLVPNLGTTGYHCKELPVPRGWNSWFPTWEPWVTIASNC